MAVFDESKIIDIRNFLKEGSLEDCAKKYNVTPNAIRCFCWRNNIDFNKKKHYHGKTHTRLYGIWRQMNQRCFNQKNAQYKYYGLKGVKVCDEWLNFENFYNWSINNNYSDNLTIDRINFNGDYCPENCRWVTMKEQGNNKSTNRIIVINNEQMTLTQCAEKYGVNPITLQIRLSRGWSIEKAICNKNFKYKENK